MEKSIEGVKVVFDDVDDTAIVATQITFITAAIKDGMYLKGETLQVDNANLRLEAGVSCFMDLTTGTCGYSHSIPGVILEIYCDAMRRKRPRLHWWTRYKGQKLPRVGASQRVPWETEKHV